MMFHIAKFKSRVFLAAVGLAFGFGSVLVGCGTFSKAREQNLYQVHIGESQADLVAALGEPKSQNAEGGGTEKWFYEVYSMDNRQIYPYTATFENGVLRHWDFDTARNVNMPKSIYLRGPASSATADRPFSY